MNAVWDGWVAKGATPARATVEAKLAAPAIRSRSPASPPKPDTSADKPKRQVKRVHKTTEAGLPGHFERVATPAQAVDRLAALYAQGDRRAARRGRAIPARRRARRPERCARASAIPSCASPISPKRVPPSSARAFAKFTEPGVYSTTVTQPEDFRRLSARAARAAGRGVRRRDRGRRRRAGNPLPLRVRERRRTRPRRRHRRRTRALLSRALAGGGRRRRSPTAPSKSAPASSGRSRCSTRRGSIIRCAGSCTTPARTGGRCSPGCC